MWKVVFEKEVRLPRCDVCDPDFSRALRWYWCEPLSALYEYIKAAGCAQAHVTEIKCSICTLCLLLLSSLCSGLTHVYSFTLLWRTWTSVLYCSACNFIFIWLKTTSIYIILLQTHSCLSYNTYTKSNTAVTTWSTPMVQAETVFRAINYYISIKCNTCTEGNRAKIKIHNRIVFESPLNKE